MTSTSLRFKKFAEEGELTLENFDVVTEALPELKDGEVLLRNLYISCDPTHRIYATGKESYFPGICTVFPRTSHILHLPFGLPR
mmetsp:Transcript_18033/g.38087  ORF Transcript_18033/g.38087 Transcript_18033/m.38087 type:complete len:84 (+) Transcript_18033:7-258(+)